MAHTEATSIRSTNSAVGISSQPSVTNIPGSTALGKRKYLLMLVVAILMKSNMVRRRKGGHALPVWLYLKDCSGRPRSCFEHKGKIGWSRLLKHCIYFK